MTQIDFLDQLGRELDGAAGRLIGHGRRSRVRGLLAPAAALAVVVAIAVAVWPGAPADPEREAMAPGQRQSVQDVLAVLRRPESEADRGAAAREGREALAKIVSGDAVFRLVETKPQGEGVVLAAGASVAFPMPGGPGTDAACLHYPGVEHGVGCWSAEDIAAARAYLEVGDDLHGLAPDGAARATVAVASGDLSAPVRDNYFVVSEFEAGGEVIAVVFHDEQGRVVASNVGGVPSVAVVAVPEETLDKAQALADAEMVPARKGAPMEEELETLNRIEERVPLPPVDVNVLDPLREPRRGASIVSFEALAERRAACLWQRYWLAATGAAGDTVAAQVTQVLQTVPRWPALREDARRHELVAFAAANGLVADVARDTVRNCRG